MEWEGDRTEEQLRREGAGQGEQGTGGSHPQRQTPQGRKQGQRVAPPAVSFLSLPPSTLPPFLGLSWSPSLSHHLSLPRALHLALSRL